MRPELDGKAPSIERRAVLLSGGALLCSIFIGGLHSAAQATESRVSMTKADGSAATSQTGRSQIPSSHWRAADRSGCVVVGVHAFGDHRAAFADLAAHLNQHGHDVMAFDQRGFGQTSNHGAYAGHDAYLNDLKIMVDRARDIAGERPVVIIAESFGASVALVAVGRGLVHCDGLILSGPGVREDLPAKPLWDALIDGAASVFGSGSVTLNQVSDMMSKTAQARFRDDPWVVRDVRADTYSQVVEMADMASLEASNVTVPTLVLYSEVDGIIARASIDALMRRLPKPATLKTYPDRPHLVFQARDRSDIEADVLHFLSTLRPE